MEAFSTRGSLFAFWLRRAINNVTQARDNVGLQVLARLWGSLPQPLDVPRSIHFLNDWV